MRNNLLRGATVKSPAARVDREAGIIRDVSVIELGPAFTHDFDIDEVTLKQVLDLGNRNEIGTKVRLSHPDACNDGTGRELGRTHDFRMSADGTRVVADLHILKAASRAPDGDLTGWLMDVAEEDPAMIGMSIHAKGDPEPRLDRDGDPLIVDGKVAQPVLRITKLVGTDVVDTPAANRAGLFASASLASGILEDLIPDSTSFETEDDFADTLAGSGDLVALAGIAELDAIKLGSEVLDYERLAGFLNHHLDRREIGHPALDASAVRRIIHRLKEPQTMPPINPGETREAYLARCGNVAGQTEEKLGAAWDANPFGGQPPAPPVTPPAPDAADAAVRLAEATAAENLRVQETLALGELFPQHRDELKPIIDAAVADTKLSVADTRKKLIEKIAELDKPAGPPSLDIGPSAGEKFLTQCGDAFVLAGGITLTGDDAEKRTKAAQASGLMALGPQQIARICLKDAGIRNVDRMSADDLFNQIMLTVGVGHTTADFPLILADSATKSMISGYNLAPVTWDRWCRIGNNRDFKTASRLRLSESPLLEERPEGEPARQGTFDEQREQITLRNYAKAISYTRQMFINDDLGAFAQLAAMMGAGANYTVERDVYANLTLNTRTGPTMSDALVLFHTTHANLASDNGVPNQSRVEDAVSDMMTQTGIGQDAADVNVGVPPSIFFAAPNTAMQLEKIIRSVWAGDVAVARDPQIAEIAAATVLKVAQLVNQGATVDWYAVAPQALAPSYEVAFLNGMRQPTVVQRQHSTVDGTTVVVSSDYAVFPTGGWQGIWRNAGV